MSNRTLQALYIVQRSIATGDVSVIQVRQHGARKTTDLIVIGEDAPGVYDELLKLTSAIEVADARANLAVSERDRARAECERLNKAVAELQDECVARRDNEIGLMDEIGKELKQLHDLGRRNSESKAVEA